MRRFSALLVFLPTAVTAATVDFVRDVQPIFREHCYQCHGEEKQKGELRLDVKAAAMKGGESHAPNIVPGQSAQSPLVQFVAGEDKDMIMPPKGERLSAEQVATLRRWVDEGAVWPESADTVKLVDRRDWWSFKPLPAPTPGQSIDMFVAAKLQESALTMSPEADRRTLIRRLHLVLHGLPPTPEEVDAFVADKDSRAYEKLVDRLLASPRYGEKWARHWLDVIAFGETHGFEVNTPRENAWPYRDYVIGAFNKDTPYPRFILEQLAGDSLGVDAATGFIVASAALLPGQIGKDEESKAKARQDELNDMVTIAGGAFLGLTPARGATITSSIPFRRWTTSACRRSSPACGTVNARSLHRRRKQRTVAATERQLGQAFRRCHVLCFLLREASGRSPWRTPAKIACIA